MEPLVTVICLCYNQERFVRQSIDSVLAQSYSNIELIVVDDASTDASVEAIKERIKLHPGIKFIALPENSGNCRGFNTGLRHAGGEYVIDLAADDILMPERIRIGVEALRKAGDKFGVHFSDAYWISEEGHRLYRHS